ncbi:MAG: glycosyltransferase family 2 protein [Gammaproteobacteria bacterium]|nr:glycosyltransferase family 2 protein [Gammaproteobacteria bacterium]
MRIAAIIPCYKVREHVVAVVEGALQHVDHVFVVDDCCPQGSGDLVRERFPGARVTVISHTENRGVGGATKTGYLAALAGAYQILVKIDGDGQMDCDCIPALVHPILGREADYTKGNRFFRREYLTTMPMLRLVGNSVLSLMAKASSGYWNVMDPTNGYTAIHATAAGEIELAKLDDRYFFESDLLFRLNLARAVVQDIAMEARYGSERSNLRIAPALLEFSLKHLRNFCKRFLYNYVVRDVSVGTLQAVSGLLLFAFGVAFGSWSWLHSAAVDRDTPVGTVMLATLPIILGFQLLLAALSFDIANVPSRPIQVVLRPREGGGRGAGPATTERSSS